MSAPDVSVLLVNFNGARLLPACLRALESARGGLALEVVAVDNDSRDGSAEWLEAQPGVRCLRNEGNFGFARAMNRALAAASGRVLLWLNPDCELEPGTLPGAVEALDSLGRPAIVGPRLLGADGRPQPSALAFSSPLQATLHVLGARRLMKLPGAGQAARSLARLFGGGAVGSYLATASDRPAPRDVDWLSGACLLVERAVAARVGPLDEDFFMYSEDEAWCRKAAAEGVARVWLPSWQARHQARATGQGSPYILCHYYRSMWLYHRKFTGAGRGIVAVSLLGLCAWRALWEGLGAILGRPQALLRCRLWAGLGRWIVAGRPEPCGPVPPPAWPPTIQGGRQP